MSSLLVHDQLAEPVYTVTFRVDANHFTGATTAARSD
jgi:hypothetical protein